jgi:methanogenic corrinoid protein MtbC1
LRQELPPEAHDMLTEYVQTAAAQLVAGSLPSDEPFVYRDMPHGALAVDYLDALLVGQRRRAVSLALDAVEEGISIEDLYLQVFQPVQHEIGRLWQINEISVAQEHYATAVTQLVMSQLYPRIFATERSGHTLVAACVGNELHEIGIRMVADLFELHGWDTFYLGANTPVASVVETVEEHGADLLAVSVTMTLHLQQVERLIEAVRASTVGGVKILVGGYPFNLVPDLWQRFGADGYAPDAKRAISLAAAAVAGEGPSG